MFANTHMTESLLQLKVDYIILGNSRHAFCESQCTQLLFAVLLSLEGLGFVFRVFWLLVGHARVLRRRDFQTSINYCAS